MKTFFYIGNVWNVLINFRPIRQLHTLTWILLFWCTSQFYSPQEDFTPTSSNCFRQQITLTGFYFLMMKFTLGLQTTSGLIVDEQAKGILIQMSHIQPPISGCISAYTQPFALMEEDRSATSWQQCPVM